MGWKNSGLKLRTGKNEAENLDDTLRDNPLIAAGIPFTPQNLAVNSAGAIAVGAPYLAAGIGGAGAAGAAGGSAAAGAAGAAGGLIGGMSLGQLGLGLGRLAPVSTALTKQTKRLTLKWLRLIEQRNWNQNQPPNQLALQNRFGKSNKLTKRHTCNKANGQLTALAN